jgi:hypothetical protein
MADPSLFHGIAVVIDDEIANAKSNIRTIQKQIESEGCHVVALADLPEARQLANLRVASFFVVDWKLYGAALAESGEVAAVAIPEGLREQKAAEMIQFLKNLRLVRCAPVFIFTNEPTTSIEERLKEHPDLYDENDPSHILVVSKEEVLAKGVLAVLSEWLDKAPSAYVLKRWETEYERAKNALFVDFYTRSTWWPLLLWNTFVEDRVPPSVELGALIGRNLLSRMMPFDFDLARYEAAFKESLREEAKYRQVLLKVLEGERFLPKEQLHANSIAAGDLFRDGKKYYVNIRPDCDCVARNGEGLDEVELYVLRACKLTTSKVERLYNRKYKRMNESDAEVVIYPVYDGVGFSVQFKELSVQPWRALKEKRIGRLLPPTVTRLQQRYAAYLQRPGMTPLPEAAVPIKAASEEVSPTPPKAAPSEAPSVSASVPLGSEGSASPQVDDSAKKLP